MCQHRNNGTLQLRARSIKIESHNFNRNKQVKIPFLFISLSFTFFLTVIPFKPLCYVGKSFCPSHFHTFHSTILHCIFCHLVSLCPCYVSLVNISFNVIASFVGDGEKNKKRTKTTTKFSGIQLKTPKNIELKKILIIKFSLRHS